MNPGREAGGDAAATARPHRPPPGVMLVWATSATPALRPGSPCEVTLDIPDLAATEAFGRRLGFAVVSRCGGGGSSDNLARGKRTSRAPIAEGLGVKNPAVVNSPTFVLIQEYPARLPIYHFDAYRLSGPREFAELGVEEYFRGAGVCLVEWADKVGSTLPTNHLRIEIEIVDANRRQFTLTASGERYEQLVSVLCGAAK